MSDEGARQGPRADAAPSDVMDELRSLHARIDELHHLVEQRLSMEGARSAEWLEKHAETIPIRTELPAWRRRTQGELRWPIALIAATGIALQLAVPQRLLLFSPAWIFPAAQGALLVVLVAVNPRRIDRESKVMRALSLMLAAMISLANGWSAGSLVVGITQGTMGRNAGQLLTTGAFIWLTNIAVFALWYWEFDRGGPVARALNLKNRYPDFQFVQMVSPPSLVPPDWEPGFFDYLYLAFTNATAFSPTDVMPMSRWAKIAMTVQALISIVTAALVVARAVNILPNG